MSNIDWVIRFLTINPVWQQVSSISPIQRGPFAAKRAYWDIIDIEYRLENYLASVS